jgi:dipeptidyl aminopeptidase/acylaminoacyl peptidase
MPASARTDIRRYLNIRGAMSPDFSPDGRSVAFLMNTTGVPQVWRVPVEGGWPEEVTFYSEAVRFVHYAPGPGGNRLIFGMDVGGSERVQLYLASDDGSDVADLTAHPQAIHEWGGWSADGRRVAFSANRDDASRFDLYVQDIARPRPLTPGPSAGQGNAERQPHSGIAPHAAAGSEARLLRRGPGGYFNAGEFSPDGAKVLVSEYPSSSNQFVHVVDVTTGEDRNLTPHDGDVRYLSPQWAPDGKSVYVLTDFHGDLLSLARIDLESGGLSFIERPAWDVEAFDISPDGWLAWTVNEEGVSRLYAKKLGGRGRALAANIPTGVIERVQFNADGSRLAFDLSGPRHNSNVWIWELGSGSVRQLSHASRAGVPDSAFVEPELVRYRSFDALEVPAWLYLPPPDLRSGPPPVVVYPHGGPESQSRPSFNAIFAYLLNRGYAVFAPNVRGSSGYGTRFMNLDNVRKRMDSVRDLAHGAFWLRDSGKIDATRMAIYGGSYGGFMVLAAITNHPELYAAAIDVVGIANFVTFLEKTGPYRRAAREAEYGSLEHDREFLDSISPIHQVEKIRTPLMVVHGANDPRVPVGEAEQIVAALRTRGVPVEYLRYEDEGHGLVKLANRLDAYPKMADFLDRYLRD